MKNSQLSSSIFLLILSLSCSLSWAALSSILEATPGAQDFTSCILSSSSNATFDSQFVFTQTNASYQSIWQERVQNVRFLKPSTPKPNVIVTPTNESLIRIVLYCAKEYGYELRLRSGGHDYEGLSYISEVPYVMIDFTNMKSINVNVANKTAWVQPGAALGEVYYAISQLTDTLYFPAGVCPTVGVGGYMGGAGYGNLLRKYGAGADNIVDARLMDVNGNILDRASMGEDLFWAIRGGGTSSFGIILAWKLGLVDVPPKVTTFILNKTLEDGVTEIFHKYQRVLPFMTKDLHMRTQIFSQYIGNTTMKTIRIMFEGIYQGTKDKLMPILNEKFPELGVTPEICEEIRIVQSTLVFWGESSSTPVEYLLNRSAIAKLNNKSKSDYTRKVIPISGLKKIWKKLHENDMSALLQFNSFGGRMAEISETAIPFPHRDGVLFQVLKTVNFGGQASDTTPVSLSRLAWLNSMEELLTPYVSSNPREAYSNYNDLDLGVGNSNYREASLWGERYWKRANFKKLIRIKAKVDPENFFKRPQSIPVFNSPLSDM